MVPSEDAILTNLRRGSLEYCVLGLLAEGERYGLELGQQLSAGGILMHGEGTLYPLLSRLRKADMVETTWRESPSGPPRRYYRLTDDGERALAKFLALWSPFSEAVNAAVAPSGEGPSRAQGTPGVASEDQRRDEVEAGPARTNLNEGTSR